jgi:hypothetical protein
LPTAPAPEDMAAMRVERRGGMSDGGLTLGGMVHCVGVNEVKKQKIPT